MNPRAMCTSTVGWARTGLLSVAAAASVWKAQVTPADETPFHWFVLTVTCLASSAGASAPGEDHNSRWSTASRLWSAQRRGFGPGEDHNNSQFALPTPQSRTAPGLRARRGSQWARLPHPGQHDEAAPELRPRRGSQLFPAGNDLQRRQQRRDFGPARITTAHR